MKAEDNIKDKVGKVNPFSVPEGYFDNFHEQIMNQLPEKEDIHLFEKKVTTWEKVRPWLYMAAMFIAILLPIRLMINSTKTNSDTAAISQPNSDYELYMDEYIDIIMDHSMMDDYTLYQYLTEADTEYLFN